jgi:hypothetical protein
MIVPYLGHKTFSKVAYMWPMYKELYWKEVSFAIVEPLKKGELFAEIGSCSEEADYKQALRRM